MCSGVLCATCSKPVRCLDCCCMEALQYFEHCECHVAWTMAKRDRRSVRRREPPLVTSAVQPHTETS